MDFSPQYIEMCRKATEIQAAWQKDNGDWVYWTENEGRTHAFATIHIPGRAAANAIWLPRQDELQAMVALDWARREVEFYDFILSKANSICPECINAVQPSNFVDGEPVFETLVNNVGLVWKSPEQAWLSFVMYNNYGKTWDGKEWDP